MPSRDVRILLAEDYPTNQQVALRHLTTAGFTVKLAEDGEQAVALFQEEGFDLVLMDIQMPVLDGYEATKRIRRIERELGADHRVPIIAMTAHAIKGYREKCLEAGMDDYLTKPLKRSELIRTVENWTENGRAQVAPPEPVDDSTASAASPVDMELAMGEFENDREFFSKVFRVFMESLEDRMRILKTAVSTMDFETVQNQAHTIKGGAGNVAAMNLFRAAEALENHGHNREGTHLDQAFAEVSAEFERLRQFGKGL